MFSIEQFAVEVRRGEGPGELHTVRPTPPELVASLNPDGVAPLRVKRGRKPALRLAAVRGLVDGRVRDVVVNKLAELHDEHGVLPVEAVPAPGQLVADPPAGRKLKVIAGPLPWDVDGSPPVLRQKYPLVGSSGPAVVRGYKVVARTVVAPEPLGGVAGGDRQPGTVPPH